MKSKNVLALVFVLSFANAYALSQEQVLNSDPIDVDGYMHERPVTDGELEQIKGEIRKQKSEVILNKEKTKGFKELSKTTEKLSETTEEYIDEKKSAQKDIADYNAKIKCLMEENPGKDCDKYVRRRDKQASVEQEVNVTQAQATSTASAPVAAYDGPFESIKLLPYLGGTQYNGDVEQLEAELSMGMRLESNITTRFSMGIGFNLAQLKTRDFANSNAHFNSQIPWYGPNYYNQYNNGREIQYRSMGVDLYGKFFITRGERFRPYVGAALGLNRATMKYTNNDLYTDPFNNMQFGNENYQTSFATGSILAGSEIMITRSFGINLEGALATGLGTSLSSQASKNITNSPDQLRLRQLGNEIINANALSIYVGAVVLF